MTPLKRKVYIKCQGRNAENNQRLSGAQIDDKDIKKSVFISQSKDIYTNLALEDWFYHNFDFKKHHVLMLWQNDPCVVVGRHQNPWLEANIPNLSNITEQGVQLARRNSGGGTVFHDNGNLNLTFFTAREHYDRKYNLGIITRALFREYGINVQISPREDLTLDEYKISGTAAKLGRSNAYHHCTLLVKANKVDLSLALQKQDAEIKTNATKSERSKVMNLCEADPNVDVTKLMTAIGWEYMRTQPFSLIDRGMELANEQKGFQMINPTEDWFPGLDKIRDQLASWEWCFGKTPKFNITKSFKVPEALVSGEEMCEDLKVTMIVEHGKIIDLILYVPSGFLFDGSAGNANVIKSLVGHRFSEDAFSSLESLLDDLVSEEEKFVTQCLKQVMTSA
ncbi:hypothetical protein JTB14_021022 [Gonioctena quinquepunctata]|nr:hypothetical protein JTB14_021022 [Gonioctena quinquepunctata]